MTRLTAYGWAGSAMGTEHTTTGQGFPSSEDDPSQSDAQPNGLASSCVPFHRPKLDCCRPHLHGDVHPQCRSGPIRVHGNWEKATRVGE